MNTEELAIKAKSGDENAFCELIKLIKRFYIKQRFIIQRTNMTH